MRAFSVFPFFALRKLAALSAWRTTWRRIEVREHWRSHDESGALRRKSACTRIMRPISMTSTLDALSPPLPLTLANPWTLFSLPSLIRAIRFLRSLSLLCFSQHCFPFSAVDFYFFLERVWCAVS
jgi:hypothetical protein